MPSPRRSAPKPVPSAAVATEAGLKKLRAELEETAGRYVARLQGEIDAVARALPGLKPKAAAKALVLLEGLQVRPRKGRRKDLKKIDLLIGDLQKLVEG
jgi:hypothetical protein